MTGDDNAPLLSSQDMPLVNDTKQCHCQEWEEHGKVTNNPFSWNPDGRMLLPSGLHVKVTTGQKGRLARSFPKTEITLVFRRDYVVAWIARKLIKPLMGVGKSEILALVNEAIDKAEENGEEV